MTIRLGLPDQPQHDGELPPMNAAVEDILALAGTELERVQLLRVLLHLVVEYIAREGGRREAMETLESNRTFVELAKPATPWPP